MAAVELDIERYLLRGQLLSNKNVLAATLYVQLRSNHRSVRIYSAPRSLSSCQLVDSSLASLTPQFPNNILTLQDDLDKFFDDDSLQTVDNENLTPDTTTAHEQTPTVSQSRIARLARSPKNTSSTSAIRETQSIRRASDSVTLVSRSSHSDSINDAQPSTPSNGHLNSALPRPHGKHIGVVGSSPSPATVSAQRSKYPAYRSPSLSDGRPSSGRVASSLPRTPLQYNKEIYDTPTKATTVSHYQLQVAVATQPNKDNHTEELYAIYVHVLSADTDQVRRSLVDQDGQKLCETKGQDSAADGCLVRLKFELRRNDQGTCSFQLGDLAQCRNGTGIELQFLGQSSAQESWSLIEHSPDTKVCSSLTYDAEKGLLVGSLTGDQVSIRLLECELESDDEAEHERAAADQSRYPTLIDPTLESLGLREDATPENSLSGSEAEVAMLFDVLPAFDVLSDPVNSATSDTNDGTLSRQTCTKSAALDASIASTGILMDTEESSSLDANMELDALSIADESNLEKDGLINLRHSLSENKLHGSITSPQHALLDEADIPLHAQQAAGTFDQHCAADERTEPSPVVEGNIHISRLSHTDNKPETIGMNASEEKQQPTDVQLAFDSQFSQDLSLTDVPQNMDRAITTSCSLSNVLNADKSSALSTIYIRDDSDQILPALTVKSPAAVRNVSPEEEVDFAAASKHAEIHEAIEHCDRLSTSTSTEVLSNSVGLLIHVPTDLEACQNSISLAQDTENAPAGEQTFAVEACPAIRPSQTFHDNLAHIDVETIDRVLHASATGAVRTNNTTPESQEGPAALDLMQSSSNDSSASSTSSEVAMAPVYDSLLKVDFTPGYTATLHPVTVTCFFVLTFAQNFMIEELEPAMVVNICGPANTTIIMARVDDESVPWYKLSSRQLDSNLVSQSVQLPHRGFNVGQAFCLVINCVMHHNNEAHKMMLPSVQISETSPTTEEVQLARIRYPLYVQLDLDDVQEWTHISEHKDELDRWKFFRHNDPDRHQVPIQFTVTELPLALDACSFKKQDTLVKQVKYKIFRSHEESSGSTLITTMRVDLLRSSTRRLDTDPLLRLALHDASITALYVDDVPAVCYQGLSSDLVVLDTAGTRNKAMVKIVLEFVINQTVKTSEQATIVLPSVIDLPIEHCVTEIDSELGRIRTLQVVDRKSHDILRNNVVSTRKFRSLSLPRDCALYVLIESAEQVALASKTLQVEDSHARFRVKRLTKATLVLTIMSFAFLLANLSTLEDNRLHLNYIVDTSAETSALYQNFSRTLQDSQTAMTSFLDVLESSYHRTKAMKPPPTEPEVVGMRSPMEDYDEGLATWSGVVDAGREAAEIMVQLNERAQALEATPVELPVEQRARGKFEIDPRERLAFRQILSSWFSYCKRQL